MEIPFDATKYVANCPACHKEYTIALNLFNNQDSIEFICDGCKNAIKIQKESFAFTNYYKAYINNNPKEITLDDILNK